MEKRRLLIAEGTEEFRLALAEALQGTFQIRQCSEGNEVRALLHSFRPDAMILDLMLPGVDGISLLQWAAAAGHKPAVLATTRFVSDYVLEAMDKLGVGYLMVKPCDVQATAARICEISDRIRPVPLPMPDPQTQASNLLLQLGVSTKLRGYVYLREALVLKANKPDQSITKELYPDVAKICGCGAIHVERSSRSAIAAAWENRDEQVWRTYFSSGRNGSVPRPTNGAFISRLADCLRTRENTPGNE